MSRISRSSNRFSDWNDPFAVPAPTRAQAALNQRQNKYLYNFRPTRSNAVKSPFKSRSPVQKVLKRLTRKGYVRNWDEQEYGLEEETLSVGRTHSAPVRVSTPQQQERQSSHSDQQSDQGSNNQDRKHASTSNRDAEGLSDVVPNGNFQPIPHARPWTSSQSRNPFAKLASSFTLPEQISQRDTEVLKLWFERITSLHTAAQDGSRPVVTAMLESVRHLLEVADPAGATEKIGLENFRSYSCRTTHTIDRPLSEETKRLNLVFYLVVLHAQRPRISPQKNTALARLAVLTHV